MTEARQKGEEVRKKQTTHHPIQLTVSHDRDDDGVIYAQYLGRNGDPLRYLTMEELEALALQLRTLLRESGRECYVTGHD